MRDIASPLDGFASPFGPGRRTLTNLLFGQNEPGFTFEPWDITTLYQDRAGTTPVTAAGQSVGLALDKSQGLRIGPELVTNGDFSNGTAGWSAGSGVTISGGIATFSAAGLTALLQLVSGLSSTVGDAYRITFTATVTSGTLGVRLASTGSTPITVSTSGTYSFIERVGSASPVNKNLVFDGSTFSGTIDNVSIKSLAGNHEVAVSDAKRGVYGWMPKTGRRNQLTYTEQFDNAAWSKTNLTASVVSGAEWNLTEAVTTSRKYMTSTSLSGGRLSVEAKPNGRNFIALGTTNNGGFWSVWLFNVSTGQSIGGYQAGGISLPTNPTITATSNGFYRCAVTLSDANSSVFMIGNGGDPIFEGYTGNGTSGITIRNPQLETGSTATAYQRVVSQYDITEAGVPTCYYVQADGVDDAYVTPTITPNTDKVQVFAGVRKLSDAARGIIAETGSGGQTGSVFLDVNNSLTVTAWFSAGTLASQVGTGALVSPISRVFTGLGDISGDTATLRVNGAQVAQSTADQGTGNYLAYPAYIYGRGGTTLPFNGLDFGHAVRFGPNLDAATIARVESLIARNTPEVTL